MTMLVAEQKKRENVAPARSLARSISKGTFFSMVASLARFGSRLILIPIIIAHLGLGGYGIWATLMVIAGYLRFGNSGIKGTFQKYVAEATGNGNFERANQLLTTGTTLFVGISAAVLIPAAIFSRTVAHVAGVPTQYAPSSATAITLLAIAYLFSNALAPFEAAVLGAHRVDLMQYVSIGVMLFDLAFCVVVLRLGYGLAAMACSVALSELGYAVCGWMMARRVIPQISLKPKYFTNVFGELVRFTGSYQLLNLMELFYVGIVPIVLLRELGPSTAGVYAICDRLTRFATLALESSLVPLLSGGTMLFSIGSSERMRAFLSKTFKMSLIATLLPLAFATAFGPSAVMAWTGQASEYFRLGILLVSITALFRCLSKVGMVLYRSTGAASMDTIAQFLRIVILLVVVFLGRQWGFYGALCGLALAELTGMIFLLEALFRKLKCFSLWRLLGEAAHLSLTALILVAAGEAVSHVPIITHGGPRLMLSMQLSMIVAVMLALLWPSFVITNFLPMDERIQILNAVLPWRRRGHEA